jgi:membrane fusion protein, copper/silver efflux system
MIKVLCALALAGAVVLASGCHRSAPDETRATVADASAKEYYTCPMHPSVVSDRPGACPICGMTLVKRSTAGAAAGGDVSALRGVSLSPSQRVMANVQTGPVVRRGLVHSISAVGVIDYAEPLQASVTARFRGRVEKLYVNFTGEVVRKGQALFAMHSPELVSSEHEYVLALQALAGLQGPGTDTVQRAQQEAMVDAVRERLMVHYGMTPHQIESMTMAHDMGANAVFTSPIHGTVVAKEVQEGQYVDEGTLLYRLADLSKVWAYLDVYEQDFRFIKVGLSVSITADAYPGEAFHGRVAFVDPALDPSSRTIRVRVELANPSGKLKPQMYVRGDMKIPAARGLVVPASAVLATGKRNIVWVEIHPNAFEPRDVVTGVSGEGGVQILSGVHEGEQVAVQGGFLLESESQLQPPAESAADQNNGATRR